MKNRLISILVSMTFVISTSCAFGTTVYVDAASTGAASPYDSWAIASTTIGAAITYATSVATDESPVDAERSLDIGCLVSNPGGLMMIVR